MKIIKLNTVIVGSGAAGFNCADRLYNLGVKNIAIVTDHINAGTSRNTGSDKQTYYKLTLSGGDPDSVREMAQTLFEGQCVDGDIALCEAALSAQGFLKLVELGVPFPRNRYGEYIGYKTDHDPRRRATSVGPYTSKMMTECLEKSVNEKGIKIYDEMQVIRLVVKDGRVLGAICLNTSKETKEDDRYVGFCCENLVFATGGPAGMYANSVYPASQLGASGLAFEAGVKGKNLTEWQYGLASTNPRWNVSGTYMQVLPRFVSAEADGSDEHEFLFDFFKDKGDLLTKVFLKGYQWPFDVRKVDGGSSIIDILVYMESSRGRKVYLDFRENPGNEEIDYSSLSDEAREYLEKAGACFGKPIDRLLHMNAPAVDFYKDKGVDLNTEMLEIALCAQHNNGGLDIDCWWQTNIEHLFAVGEVAGSHGVYRPGGSALNAGQVGSTRAAQYIAAKYTADPNEALFKKVAGEIEAELRDIEKSVMNKSGSNIGKLWKEATTDMSITGSAIRDTEGIKESLRKVEEKLHNLKAEVKIDKKEYLAMVFRYRDMLISQYVYLSAMADYVQRGGRSRGSALYTDMNGKKPYEQLPDTFTFIVDDGSKSGMIQEISYKNGKCEGNIRPVREIPEDDDFFENIWREFRSNGCTY